MKKLIIEARINEYEMRDRNPNVPWTAREIATDAQECREAGASIVHFHARMPDGAPELGTAACGEVIARIKENSDILVHPTLGSLRKDLPLRERLKPILDLAMVPTTRPDFLPLCLSSPNWDFFDSTSNRFVSADKIYINPTDDLIGSVQALRQAGVGLSCVCWEIGATRRVAAFLDAGILRSPVYLPFHLTSGGMLAGHPGTEEGLDSHLAFLPKDRAIEWAALNLHGSILPLAEKIIGGGGHVQIGLGDYHYAELGRPTNADLIRRIVEIAKHLGREVASPEEAREMLAVDDQASSVSRTSYCKTT